MHKTNVLTHAGGLWARAFAAVAPEFPDVTTEYQHIDAAAMFLVSNPQRYDVVVTDNLFGDILTDLGAAISGSLGLAASGNINPERRFPSMFEPIHGSAPDIAGSGVANPIGAIWAGALMLHHLGETQAHDMIVEAVSKVLGRGQTLTPDLGGNSTTTDLGKAIRTAIETKN